LQTEVLEPPGSKSAPMLAAQVKLMPAAKAGVVDASVSAEPSANMNKTGLRIPNLTYNSSDISIRPQLNRLKGRSSVRISL
jgi:hypothetical protein